MPKESRQGEKESRQGGMKSRQGEKESMQLDSRYGNDISTGPSVSWGQKALIFGLPLLLFAIFMMYRPKISVVNPPSKSLLIAPAVR